jgi:hypothetical protein
VAEQRVAYIGASNAATHQPALIGKSDIFKSARIRLNFLQIKTGRLPLPTCSPHYFCFCGDGAPAQMRSANGKERGARPAL